MDSQNFCHREQMESKKKELILTGGSWWSNIQEPTQLTRNMAFVFRNFCFDNIPTVKQSVISTTLSSNVMTSIKGAMWSFLETNKSHVYVPCYSPKCIWWIQTRPGCSIGWYKLIADILYQFIGWPRNVWEWNARFTVLLSLSGIEHW